MQIKATARFLRWIWIAGLVVWIPAVIFLWWQVKEATTFSQASLYTSRLSYISVFGVFWFIAPNVFKAFRKKTQSY
jgi:uncharacterized membrane protein